MKDQQEQLIPTTGTTVDSADTNDNNQLPTINDDNDNDADNTAINLPGSASHDANQSNDASIGRIQPVIDTISEYCLYIICDTFQHKINQ